MNYLNTFKYVKNKTGAGFSLVEIIVSIAIFLIIATSVYQGFTSLLDAVTVARLKISASNLANEQFEIVRNLSYSDVGIFGGLPSGRIAQNQTLTRDNTEFFVKTNIRNIDDPFDGTIGGSPNDTSPADYKLVELEISCPLCRNFAPLIFSTHVAPKNLEGSSANGALFIRVLDANGQPVQGARVYIENNQAVPSFIIDDTTNNDGLLGIIDTPPGAEAYEIIVSKEGYSEERTYATGSLENPNPTKPHATIVAQQVTQISFAIDRVSMVEITSTTETCSTVANIDFNVSGTKLIGQSPDVLKYSESYETNSAGIKNIENLEWDTYNFSLNDASYDLIGAIPLLPLSLGPNTNQNLKFIVGQKNPLSLLVTIKDSSTLLPLSGAEITIEKTGYSNSLTTGRGFLRQTDWSGGAGQDDFIDDLRYFSSDGNLDVDDPAGELRLKKTFETYSSSGNLTSSTFDTGSASNFYQILWKPEDQQPETGSDSVRFQIASNNDKMTWNFLGPDGTSGTFYTLSNTNINSVHNNDRYIRYKIFLRTEDINFTPNVAEISFTFNSLCVPSGQVIFQGLTPGDYTITVSKLGYQIFSDTVEVTQPWQQKEVILNP
jgi:prepilin-type N-terminal cleavage/methylation domain-containing protein